MCENKNMKIFMILLCIIQSPICAQNFKQVKHLSWCRALKTNNAKIFTFTVHVIYRSYWHILNENFKISTKLATKPPLFLNITCIKDHFADNPGFANFVENLKNKFEFLKSSLPDAYFCRSKISIRPIIWMLILGLRLINSQFLFRVMKI